MNEFHASHRTSIELKGKAKKKPSTSKTGPRTDREVRDFLLDIIDPHGRRKAKIIPSDNPSKGRGGTGPKVPDGSGAPSKDQ
jgi:hypothetical protein